MVTDWVNDKLRTIYGDGLPVARLDATASSGCVFRDVNACEGIGREIAALRAENARMQIGISSAIEHLEAAILADAAGDEMRGGIERQAGLEVLRIVAANPKGSETDAG